MAIGVTIDWATYTINIPRSGMTLVQTTPTEIRELNINEFRLELKDIEDSIPAMPQPDTHKHNTEVSLGGITYARVVEILDPYSLTFENGQYAVNLVGANSNLGDKVNVNQVSVRSNNSAGLISSPDIEFSSFNGGVMINVDTGVIGTSFPTGTERQKSNNITDARLIANYRGFKKFYLDSNIEINGGSELNGFEFVGESPVATNLIFDESAQVSGVTVSRCNVGGILDGNSNIFNSEINNITYFNGDIHNSKLKGTINLKGGVSAFIENCAQAKYDYTPIIDMGGAGQDLIMTNYSGQIIITNLTGSTPTTGSTTGSTEIGIGLDQGQVILDSTSVISGTVFVSGIGDLIDENGNNILSGTWNGSVKIINRLINRETITEASQLGDSVYVDTGSTTTGILFPVGSKRIPVNNLTDAITIAENENINRLIFLSDYTFPDGTFIQDYIIEGQGILDTKFTFVTAIYGCVILGCSFKKAILTGDFTGVKEISNSKVIDLGSIGLQPSSQEISVNNTLIDGIITLPSNFSGKLTVINCWSNVVGTATPILDMGNSSAYVQIRGYYGGIKLVNVTDNNIMSIDLDSGQVKLDPATVTGGTIVVRGNGKVINADTGEYIYSGIWNGGVTILSEANTPTQTAKQVWDESITQEEHNLSYSAGRKLREISTTVFTTGYAVTGTTNTIILSNEASTVDGAYDPSIISIISGTGYGQTRLILQYIGITKTAVVDRNWKVLPDSTSEYTISASPGREHVHEGLAQTGGTNTITMGALASNINGMYVGQIIFIRSGTGDDQAGQVIAYDGTTKVATIDRDWIIIPDNTSAYVTLPTSIITASLMADSVWNKTLP